MNKLSQIFTAKAARVFVFGLLSVMTPVYVAHLGYSALYVGIVLAAMIAGNIFSNLLLTWYGNHIGRKRILLAFSLLMFVSGIVLFSTDFFPLILVAVFIGNIGTSGTEAGPFQSIESGILPDIAGTLSLSRAYGLYNFIGYVCSAIGALSARTPSYFNYDFSVFRALYLVYAIVGLFLFVVYSTLATSIEPRPSGGTSNEKRSGLSNMSKEARKDLTMLSALTGVDAFGGGFTSQSVLVVWFYFVYHLSLNGLSLVFFATNVITAISIYGAGLLAERLGNLRTMVYTHLLSNVFLLLVPLVGSLTLALLFLFARQSMSQMDVTTRQVFMAGIFNSQDRVNAYAVTNTSRSVATIFGSPLTGAMLAAGLVSLPLLVGASTKIGYDLAIYGVYRKRAR